MTDDEFRAKLLRESKPPSRAMEQRFYGDPANPVEFSSEIERRKKAKKAEQPKQKLKGMR